MLMLSQRYGMSLGIDSLASNACYELKISTDNGVVRKERKVAQGRKNSSRRPGSKIDVAYCKAEC